MTVSYNLDVSSVTTFSFFRLLFRWRGSIWKSVISELTLWVCLYYVVFCIYRYVMDKDAQSTFERIAAHCDKKLDYIPLTFMLGFFVTVIIDRWRNIFNNMGWIENIALTVSTLLRGDTKELILTRRTIIRYLVLSQVLVFRDISMKVRRRFPNLESLVTAGFLHENEKQDLEKINIVYNKYWAPINWALSLCFRAHTEGHIAAAPSLNACITEIKSFRTSLALLCNFDWVPVPIAYPQVVFLAVRVYFIICLVSRQFILGEAATNKSVIDLYVPFMTILQFIFFVGWMKVAEALLNPLGEDDDDFECNFLIDKNIATGLSIVDETYDYCPKLLPDRFMDPNYVPVYSEESQKHGHDNILAGSAEGIKLADSNENVKMVSVSIRGSQNDIRGRSFLFSTRKLYPLEPRSYSVQPVRLGAVKPVIGGRDPERPYTPFDLSNGFEPSKSIFADTLEKVDEEDTIHSHSGAHPLNINTIRSTVESVSEAETRSETVSEPRSRTTGNVRRKLSQALRFTQPRSYSVQPVRLGAVKPVIGGRDPERPYTPFDLSNGFEPSKSIFADTLEKVDEEDTIHSHTGAHPLNINTIRSTVESVSEAEVPDIIKKELEGDRKDK
ncbi:bestrophin-3 domain protein [Oesophagostomum dentatum]|uniref:Bestrophin homolog n=1 Tax=Oesophagostomum dentatum TaxID=61180 RepID=A0A0B1T043_OESDE|nr:bestrophin-3 domain protein [Oesophagostomum dentatum]